MSSKAAAVNSRPGGVARGRALSALLRIFCIHQVQLAVACGEGQPVGGSWQANLLNGKQSVQQEARPAARNDQELVWGLEAGGLGGWREQRSFKQVLKHGAPQQDK